MKRLRPSATSLRRAATRVSSAGHSFGPTSLNRRDFALLLEVFPCQRHFRALRRVAFRPTARSNQPGTQLRRKPVAASNMARRCGDLQEFWQVKSFNSTNE